LRTIASYAVVLVIVGLSAWLRITIADRESVWRDEAQTVSIARESFPSGILGKLKHDGNSPLFYLLAHFVIAGRSAPHRELQDRSLSVTLGVVFIPLVFIAGRMVGRRSFAAGLTAAAIGALSPLLVDLSTQARPYAAVAVVTALMALGALRMETHRGRLLYAAAATAGFYLHALFATTIAAFAVVWLVQALRTARLRPWFGIHAIVLGAITPGLFFLREQVATLTIAGGRIPWGTTPTLPRLLRQAMVLLTASEGDRYRLFVLCVALVFLGLALLENPEARRVGAVAGLSLLFSFLLAIRSGGFETRYHVAVATLVLITLSAGAPAMIARRRRAGIALVAASIVAMGAIHLNAVLPNARIPRSSARDAAALLKDAASRDLIVIVPDSVAVGVNYYLSPRSPQIDPPELGRVDTIDFRGWSERHSDPATIAAIETTIQQAAASKRRLWLVVWPPILGPGPALSRKDAAHSAIPAQLALSARVMQSISAHYEPAAMHNLGPALEQLAVVEFKPRDNGR
jgi:hypothetical protein